nr:odorant receptor 49b-like [Osmia lignaria]
MFNMQEERYTDTSIKLSTFYMKCIGLWIAENHTEERQRKVAIFYTIWVTLFSSLVECREFYFSWGDLSSTLYVSCNILSCCLTVFKIYVILAHKLEFINLIVYMRDHFWNGKYDLQEKAILVECRKVCTFFTISVTFIGECAVVAYVVTAIVSNIGKNESDRILIFNMWLNSLSITPYYEIMFFLQMISLYHIGVCYFCFDNLFCILSVHVASQFRILQYRFEKLCATDQERNEKLTSAYCTTEFYEKFKNCIKQHQVLINYCNLLEKVYTVMVLGQVTVFSVLICLFGYQILLADAPITRRAIFICLILGSTSLLFMFTYSCHGLIEQSDKVAVAAYSTMWTNLPMTEFGKMLRNDLLMVIQRSRRVCCMTACGFFPVSLETFTTILSTAASYFTLLRNNADYT